VAEKLIMILKRRPVPVRDRQCLEERTRVSTPIMGNATELGVSRCMDGGANQSLDAFNGYEYEG
jgi:hypothetical protein